MPPDIQPGGASEDQKWTVMVFMGADTIAAMHRRSDITCGRPRGVVLFEARKPENV